MKTISPKELKALKDSNEEFQLIDVREPDEYELVNIGGTLIPLAEVRDRMGEIRSDVKVVMMCRSGQRSRDAVQFLEAAYGCDNLYNLTGGILGYAVEVDPSLKSY